MLANPPSSHPHHYQVIYADPPWKFGTYSQKGLGRSAEAHYDCMTIEDICSLKIEEYAAPNRVLFLWVTDPLLREGLRVIDAWGFIYKTVGFYWAKCGKHDTPNTPNTPNTLTAPLTWPIGTGYWTRANPELCLLATRGSPRRKNYDVPKLIVSPRREHSRKPAEAYDRIERLCDGPYLELFARETRPGWDSWGREVSQNYQPSPRRWASNSYPTGNKP